MPTWLYVCMYVHTYAQVHLHTHMYTNWHCVIAHSCSPKLVWGNQEPMWPINPAALRTAPTQRTCQLAQAKRNHREEDMYM